ncbi:MAG: hypothetical protein ACRYFX_12655 [Janthinobacterium lividum]
MLNDPHCLRCDCDRHGGYIEYSIRHLHPDWDVLTQTCEIRSMTDEGRFIYHSDFQLFPVGSSIPASFGHYAPALKEQLWQAIFRVKRYYLSTYEPDVVQHLIKQPYSAAQRYHFYRRHLNLPEYAISHDRHNIWYIRAVEAEELL